MLTNLDLKRKPPLTRSLPEGVKPISIRRDHNANPANVSYSDGHASPGTCIRCFDTPCMKFEPSEMTLKSFPDFPGDKNSSVCPTEAINWSGLDGGLSITPDLCFGCGLCVSRCPTGAIYFDKNVTAVIHDGDTRHLKLGKVPESGKHNLFDKLLSENPLPLGELNEVKLEMISSKLNRILSTGKGSLPNTLARNMLRGLGWKAVSTRTGDTHVRMDIVAEDTSAVIAGEVELTNAVIDAPRNVLENIAVLSSRHGIEKKRIVGLVVTKELPNQRSEYWQVIDDVTKVLEVKIHTLSLLAMIYLVWAGKKLTRLPYADNTKPEIRSDIEFLTKTKAKFALGYLSFFETTK